MAKKPPVEDDAQVQTQTQGQGHPAGQTPAQPIKPNRTFWKVLVLPSILILAASGGLYYLRPMRDAFISGQTYGSYLLFGTFAAISPKFWVGGVAAVLFLLWLIVAISRTIARGEWGYWQRLLGLIALTASGVILFLIWMPEIGTDARDAGWTSLNGHYYHLLVQNLPAPPNVNLRFSVFDCDQGGITCQRVQMEEKSFVPGDRVPPLEILQINVDGQVIVTRGNSPTYYTLYRPQ